MAKLFLEFKAVGDKLVPNSYELQTSYRGSHGAYSSGGGFEATA